MRCGQGLEVHEAGGPDVHALRLRRTVGDDVAAELTPGALDRGVDLALGHLESLGEDLEVVDQRFHGLVDAGPGRRGDLLVLDAVLTGRHLVEHLVEDANRLTDLVQPDRVAVEAVPVGPDDDVEVDLVVAEVRLVAAEVPRVAGRAEDGPGRPEGERLLGGDHADALQPSPPDRLAGHERVELRQTVGQRLEGAQQVVTPSIGQVGRDAAGPDVVVVHPQSGDDLEEPQQLLALAPAVQHHADRAEVHAVGGHEEHVRREPVDLAHQHADPLGPLGHLDLEQLLGGERERELGEQRCGVVHPGHVGGALEVGELLARLLHAGVEVADHRLGPGDQLAVELEHDPQHAVGRRVLGTHVHDHPLADTLVGGLLVPRAGLGLGLGHAQHRVVAGQVDERGVHGLEVGDRRLAGRDVVTGGRSIASCGAPNRAIACSSGRRCALELHRDATDVVVRAQRVALPLVGHEDPGVVGMAVERDPEQVPRLALVVLDPGVEPEDGRARSDRTPAPGPGGGCGPARCGSGTGRPPRTVRRSRRGAGRGSTRSGPGSRRRTGRRTPSSRRRGSPRRPTGSCSRSGCRTT